MKSVHSAAALNQRPDAANLLNRNFIGIDQCKDFLDYGIQEKEALKFYKRRLGSDYRTAIETFVSDWHLSGIQKSLEFSLIKLFFTSSDPLN